jgi:hypothetical protein
MAPLRYHPGICIRGLSTTTKPLRISCNPAEIRTQHLENVSLHVTATVFQFWGCYLHPEDGGSKLGTTSFTDKEVGNKLVVKQLNGFAPTCSLYSLRVA